MILIPMASVLFDKRVPPFNTHKSVVVEAVKAE